jgi:hypothetical protein
VRSGSPDVFRTAPAGNHHQRAAGGLGYELKQIADSLEVLLNAEVLTRTQNPTHTARMYVLSAATSFATFFTPSWH